MLCYNTSWLSVERVYVDVPCRYSSFKSHSQDKTSEIDVEDHPGGGSGSSKSVNGADQNQSKEGNGDDTSAAEGAN
jgi:hypothetical protein